MDQFVNLRGKNCDRVKIFLIKKRFRVFMPPIRRNLFPRQIHISGQKYGNKSWERDTDSKLLTLIDEGFYYKSLI
jgi:hypothetical protein